MKNPDATTHDWGVFTWHENPRYKISEAVKTFRSNKAAQKWADAQNEKDARNAYVVRRVKYLSNPTGPAGGERLDLILQARRVYQDFTGHTGEFDRVKVRLPDMPKALAVIGECTGILYDTVRDGELEKYIHRFRKSSRPLMCVSPDGLQIYLVGGNFKFTDRGIVDK
jgi:hypothetical protein